MPERALVYVHAHAPPTPGGTPVLIHRLLSGLSPATLHVLTDRALRRAVERDRERSLAGRYHYFLRKGPRGNRWRVGRALNGAVNFALAIVAGIQAATIVRRTGAGWVVSVADEGFSPLAGAVAARLARRPHLVMVFDLWEENAYTEFERGFAHLVEGPLFRRASALIVTNEQMAEHYSAKHRLRSHVLATPVDPELEPTARGLEGPPHEVLFAGAIYWAQEDALRRLAEAVAEMPEFSVTLLGSWDAENLARRSIRVDRVEDEVAPAVFRSRLASADILFLGLSFGSGHPDVIRTASPAKLPEYMLSGRPLLIHAPRGSHVAEYGRTYGFAEVVDEPDVEQLAAALRRIVADPEAAAARALKARELALERHAAPVVRARFAALAREAAGR